MARRAQGDGTIYKREDGRFSVLLSLGLDENGKRLRRSTTCKTQKEARETLKQWLEERDARLDASKDARSMTVTILMADFLQFCRDKGLRPKTLENYELLSRAHIVPVLGKIEVQSLDAWTITRFLTTRKKVARTGTNAASEKLSPQTVRQMRMVLRKALEIARKRRIIATNPADDAEAPSPGHYQAMALTVEQAATLLDALPSEQFGHFYIVMLGLGMRPGEVRGLKWHDIEFAGSDDLGGWLTVQRQVQRVDGAFREVPVKTRKGNRRVALPGFVSAALRQHRERQQTEVQLAAADGKERPAAWADLVFQNAEGNPLEERYVVRRFHELTDRLELPPIRLYDLRRTCISVLHARGVPLAVIKDIVGHSQISVTADVYMHTFDPSRDEAARIMDATLRNNGSGKK